MPYGTLILMTPDQTASSSAPANTSSRTMWTLRPFRIGRQAVRILHRSAYLDFFADVIPLAARDSMYQTSDK